MRNVGLKTPTSGEKKTKCTNSEKKLIQARLPFKIVSPSVAKETEGSTKSDGRKRKLSNEENNDKPMKLFCNQEIKENLIIKTKTSKDLSQSAIKDNTVNDNSILIVSDDSQDLVSQHAGELEALAKSDNDVQSIKIDEDQKILNFNSNISTKKESSRKLKIKLPLGNKNKKRKSGQLNVSATTVQGSDSSDVETVSKNLNPLKKAKLLNESIPIESDSEDNVESDNANQNTTLVNSESISLESTHSTEKDNLGNVLNVETKINEKNTIPITAKGIFDERGKHVTKSEVQSKPFSNKLKNKILPECRVNLARLKEKPKDDENMSNYSDDSIIITEDESRKNDDSKSDGKSDEDLDKSVNLSLTEEETVKLVAKTTTPGTKKKLEVRQRLKEERELKLQKGKEEKHRAREEKEREKRKEREERENQRKKEKEEKELKRLSEMFAKNEEKRRKEEAKEEERRRKDEAKEEERRKKDEAKEEDRRKKEDEKRRKDLEREEAENKKKKASEAFTKFFVAPKSTKTIEENQNSKTNDSIISLAFRPFQVKCDMKLAPTVRKSLDKDSIENLDKFLECNAFKTVQKSELYLTLLKEKKIVPSQYNRSTPKDEQDVVYVEDELEGTVAIDETRSPMQKYRSKYFLFHENRRPPFHGTWRKKSNIITPRRPLTLDKTYFDYGVDSDDEWEEEDPGGESLNGTDDEKESEDDDYEVDNELFVPHGHLSDEELQSEEEQIQNNSREAQKAKLMLLQQVFAQEMKKKTEKIKPRLIGTVWEDVNGCKPELCPDIVWDYLNKRAMMFTEPLVVEEPAKPEPITNSPNNEKPVRLNLNEDLIKVLIRLVHGNRHNKIFLIQEFLAYVCKLHKIDDEINLGPKKTTIREKIEEIAEWTAIIDNVKKNKKKLCWIVSADVLKKFSMEDLDTKNQWTYLLEPKKKKSSLTVFNEKEVEDLNNETEKQNVQTSTSKPKIKKSKEALSKDESKTQAAVKVPTPKVKTKSLRVMISKSNKDPTTKITTPEKAISSIRNTNNSQNLSTPKIKKRVPLLMSVGRGDEVPLQTKNALISQFLQKNKKAPPSKTPGSTTNNADSSTDVILIE